MAGGQGSGDQRWQLSLPTDVAVDCQGAVHHGGIVDTSTIEKIYSAAFLYNYQGLYLPDLFTLLSTNCQNLTNQPQIFR